MLKIKYRVNLLDFVDSPVHLFDFVKEVSLNFRSPTYISIQNVTLFDPDVWICISSIHTFICKQGVLRINMCKIIILVYDAVHCELQIRA